MPNLSRKAKFPSRVLVLFSALLLIMPLLLNLHTVRADIYQWQDADGHWHFSDSPPSDVESKRLTTTTRPDRTSPQRPEALAPAPARLQTTDQGPGLFWRVSKDGRQPSYLLGTIHSTDPRITRLRPAVETALDKADRFVMEMILDSSALLQFGTSMMLTNGNDLESLLGTQMFQKVVTAMAAYGMPEMAVRQFKPWVVMAMLSMPKPTGEAILDLVLYQRAQNLGKPATGLESVQEQLAVFESLSMDDQVALLKMTINQLPSLPGMFETLVQAYLADNLNRIETLASQYRTQQNMSALKRFFFKLNDERNRRMVRRTLPYLEQGNTFIAVGALHLAGPTGLITQLRNQGYTLEPIR